MKKRIRQGILVILTMLLASSVCFAADSEGTKLPDSAANTPAPPAFIEMDDGDYAIPVSLEGGSGKASVTTPAALKVKDGTAVMTLVWGSENYDYMISGGVKYQRVSEEGYSTFEIPVTSFTQPMTVIADTTAMSVPHEVEYTLTLSPDDIMAGNQTPQAAAQRVVYGCGHYFCLRRRIACQKKTTPKIIRKNKKINKKFTFFIRRVAFTI